MLRLRYVKQNDKMLLEVHTTDNDEIVLGVHRQVHVSEDSQKATF